MPDTQQALTLTHIGIIIITVVIIIVVSELETDYKTSPLPSQCTNGETKAQQDKGSYPSSHSCSKETATQDCPQPRSSGPLQGLVSLCPHHLFQSSHFPQEVLLDI